VVLHFHAGGFRNFYATTNRLIKSYIRFIIRHTDTLICISDRALDFFKDLSPKTNIIALDNPVQINDKTNNEISSYPIRILFLSRINKKKGVFDMVDLVNMHQQYLRGKIILEMGGAGETEHLQQLIKEYKIEDIIDFKGWVTGDDKAEMIRDCNVLILPSYFEELPMTILEAMSYGKPVISTDVGGIPKVLKNGVNGWMFEPGDKEALFKIFQTIIENPELLVTYGSNSYDIIDEYSVKKIMGKLDLVYESMMES
jgi:glycosyltransferase involved in cell wall biosynthesis